MSPSENRLVEETRMNRALPRAAALAACLLALAACNGSEAPTSPGADAAPAADDAAPAKLEIAGPDLAALIAARDLLDSIKAEASMKGGNMANIRALLGIDVPAAEKKTGSKC